MAKLPANSSIPPIRSTAPIARHLRPQRRTRRGFGLSQLRAIGPKHLNAGNEGDSPSDPATLSDNPGTWLDFTDLVFLDPIGTGFSRSLVDADQTRKLFWTTEPDIEYLSRCIYDWLVKNDRLGSRKYLVGESYGGFRGPRITYFLQSQLGVAMNGVVLVSPYLNPTLEQNGDLSPLPWLVTLPSITAAHLEREHQLTPEAMKPVIDYTLGEYATTLIKGPSDPAATDAMIKKVTEMTGLDPTFVKESGGRLETGAYLREVHREEGKLGSVYDSNVTMFDPFPYAPEQRANDPLLATLIAPTTTAMVDFDTRVVGWKVEARYNALSYEVGSHWSRDQEMRAGSTAQLREAVAADPKLHVMIVHGWNDLSCPSWLHPHRQPDAAHGRPNPRLRPRISRRPHVLHARSQPGRITQRRDGDVQPALSGKGIGCPMSRFWDMGVPAKVPLCSYGRESRVSSLIQTVGTSRGLGTTAKAHT